VGYVALLVALMLTPLPGYASHLVVRTSDIVDGAVTAAKIRDGAVVRAKVRDGAVTRAKVRDGAVNAAKLADGAASRAKIRDGAVNSAKLADGAVGTVALAAGSVVASKLATITQVQATSPVTAHNSFNSVLVDCPAGTRIISGGFIGLDWRVDVSTQNSNGWLVAGRNLSGGNSNLHVRAYCLAG
jgi:hypothetical protein